MAKNKFPGMGGNINNMLKQAQKMQKQMEQMQAELEEKTVEATSGGGAVTVVVTGKKEVSSIKISPDAIDLDDVEMLEDLILVAVNDALSKVDEMTATEMGKITGGFNVPGLF
ncbi:MAG: YbaB/EbfC family nucleoid-associated protein [Eubacteriales bacterium]|jgi:DNA-binding YbaB/EbfC family protein|nr:YbaB/EbfC family nucleoid-associated protein [Eubacteriales bacterium]